jgi:hypothetical protein
VSHGDDHFFPGPVDITWDLAGAIVEWDLGIKATEYLLHRFRQYSGRQLQGNIGAFCLAYAIFRMGICRMAIPTSNPDEQCRLQQGYAHYRSSSEKFLRRFTLPSQMQATETTEKYAA